MQFLDSQEKNIYVSAKVSSCFGDNLSGTTDST